MNWTETRERLISAGIAAEELPEDWRLRIDLRGADLLAALEAIMEWCGTDDGYHALPFEAALRKATGTEPTEEERRAALDELLSGKFAALDTAEEE